MPWIEWQPGVSFKDPIDSIKFIDSTDSIVLTII